jgi:FdhE protein
MPEWLYLPFDQKPSPRRHGDTEKKHFCFLLFRLLHLWLSLCLRASVVNLGFALRRVKPDNRAVALTVWQQRIRRAEFLAKKHSYAAEMLGFYIHVARFQEDLFGRISESSAGVPPARGSQAQVSFASEWAGHPLDSRQGAGATGLLLDSLPAFLSLVEKKAPVPLAEVAHQLRDTDPDSWPDLLNDCWNRIAPPTDPKEFLVLAFLQPYAEYVRTQAAVEPANSTSLLCPFCNRKPGLGILRQQGDGGRRSLLCVFCLTEWEFRRVVCPGCAEEDHAKLPVYTAEELPYIRVECCDTCKTYIKSIDLTKNGLADPLVDELASIPLNLWAQEHGYAKLRPNLLGM